MAISIVWDSETTMRHVYEGSWRWDDLYAVLEETTATLEDYEHVVDIIADFSNSSMLPPGPTSHFKHIEGFIKHPRVGKVIAVGTNTIIETFMRIFMRFTRSNDHFLFASTLEEAHDKLNDLDHSGK